MAKNYQEVTELEIWQILSSGEPAGGMLADFTDGEKDLFRARVMAYHEKFQSIEKRAYHSMKTITESLKEKSDQIKAIRLLPYADISMAMMNQESYSQMIWQMIKP